MPERTPNDTRTEVMMALTVVASLTYLFGGTTLHLPSPESPLANTASLQNVLQDNSPSQNPGGTSPDIGQFIQGTPPADINATNSPPTLSSTPVTEQVPTREQLALTIKSLNLELETIQQDNRSDMERFILECNDWSLPCSEVYSEDMNSRSRRFTEIEKKLKIANFQYQLLPAE